MKRSRRTFKTKRNEADIPSDSEDDETTDTLFRQKGNQVYFWGDVSKKSVLTFTQHLKNARDYALINSDVGDRTQPRVMIHINSDGGCLFSGLAAYDFMKRINDVELMCFAEGCVASAATLLFLGGHVRVCDPNATILIHQIRAGMWGSMEFERLKDEYQNNTKFMDIMRSIYSKETKIPKKVLNELFTREIHLTMKECASYEISNDL